MKRRKGKDKTRRRPPPDRRPARAEPAPLPRGQRRKANGEVYTYFNLRMPPTTKVRLVRLAPTLDKLPGEVLLEALYLAHPALRPDADDRGTP